MNIDDIMAAPEPQRAIMLDVMAVHTLMIEFSNLAAHCLNEPAADVYRVLADMPRHQMVEGVSSFAGWERLMLAFATHLGVYRDTITARASSYDGKSFRVQ